ncbi:hypothetical protein TA3x_002125 [Tundrisphaera sp. TA3]|uniref:hypothetical protein n=1 Tax=Tundrisphaera sp. TA3 TaxID=3435775 RepID=UPI003EBB853F
MSRVNIRARNPHRLRHLALESLERRQVLSGANGALVTSLTHVEVGSATALVVRFDEPMNPARAESLSEYNLIRPGRGKDQIYGTAGEGASIPLRSATYDEATRSVTLLADRRLSPGYFYRLTISGDPLTGLASADGIPFDGDADLTPGGDYRNLIGWGKTLRFADNQGDVATLRLAGAGQMEVTREIGGDVQVVRVSGANPYRTTLSGGVQKARRGNGQVAIPVLEGANEVITTLARPTFAIDSKPLVASANFPYALQITPVALPSALALQSMTFAQADGKWLMIGGRTNGLHNFDGVTPTNPDGGFPRQFQNRSIVVIDPSTGRTWEKPWAETGVSALVADALSSTNQQSYQEGDTLYTVGGYGLDSSTGLFTTFDTLTAIDVPDLIRAVTLGGDVAATVRQARDPRLRATGGDMEAIDGRTYLVFGQDFQGRYTGSTADISQVYNNTIASFRIVDNAKRLGITQYTAQVDPIQFHRRDYNLAHRIDAHGNPGLVAIGGVFTPDGNGYRNSVYIDRRGRSRVDYAYQQFFSQYNSPKIPLFDARDRSSQTILLGGISLTSYDPATGQFTQDTGLPFVNDVSTTMVHPNGSTQEYAFPTQLPFLLGAGAAFFANPDLPTLAGGVVRLDRLKSPTDLGIMFGGIFAQQPNFGNSTASALAYRITLIPRA